VLKADREKASRVRRDVAPRVVYVEAVSMSPPVSRGRYETTIAATVAGLATGPGSATSRGAARRTSHRLWWTMSRLYSWLTGASSAPQRHRPRLLYSTSTSPMRASPSMTTRSTTGS
jgi:hypothetical protein